MTKNRKTIIDKVKSETVDALEVSNYQELINQVNSLETRLSSLESSNTELNTTVNTLNAKVNKKCVVKAYTSGSATTMSFNGSDSDWQNISLTNIIKSSDDCGITLENGILKIDDSKIHTVLVTASVFLN